MHNEIECLLLLPPPKDSSDPDLKDDARDLQDSETHLDGEAKPALSSEPTFDRSTLAADSSSIRGSSMASGDSTSFTAQVSKSAGSWINWCITM